MKGKVIGNYLKTHRQRHGLSQRELGRLVGYHNEWQVSRHERSKAAPPLLIALGYQEVLRVPVSVIFEGFQSVVAEAVKTNLREFKAELEQKGSGGRMPKNVLQKLEWLNEIQTG